MSKNIATFSTFIIMILIAGTYYFMADKVQGFSQGGLTLGPGAFPKILAVILIILSVIGIIQQVTNKKEDVKLNLSGIGLVFVTVGLLILYFISWIYLGYFYINTFLFMFILMTILSLKIKLPLKKILYVNLPVTIVVLLIVYVLFDVLLRTRL